MGVPGESGRPRIAYLLRPARQPAGGEGGGQGQEIAPRVSYVARHVIERLREAGAQVDALVAENAAWDLAAIRPEYDVYVLESKSALSLSLAGALGAAGARVINPYRPDRFGDKIAATTVLAAAGVPLPRSWAVAGEGALRTLLTQQRPGALLLKPPRGSLGQGIRRVEGLGDLDGERGDEVRRTFVNRGGQPQALLAQEAVPSQGEDLKVYVAGEWVAAITRPYPVVTEQDKRGKPADVPPKIRDVALDCGRALGLELYGVDFLVAGDDFWVVDVNGFPSYRGVAGAPERIAEYLLARAR
jgi:ribosomal protein S6--L-glutamate ligase